MGNYSCSEIRSYNAHQLFANAYYDFVNDSRWTPYAGAGIGWARTNLDYWSVFVRKPEVEYLQIAFGVQLMTGIDYALTDRASVGAVVCFQAISFVYFSGRTACGNPSRTRQPIYFKPDTK